VDGARRRSDPRGTPMSRLALRSAICGEPRVADSLHNG
jgi:hypothetical protein